MAQSLAKIVVHIIYHIKTTSVQIREEDNNELYAFISDVIKRNGSIPILINGVEDHLQILCLLSKNMSLAKLVEKIKSDSSRWIKTLHPYYKNFTWQRGYGGFSISSSTQNGIIQYIENQKEHHKQISFEEEYLMILDTSDTKYDDQYLWTD